MKNFSKIVPHVSIIISLMMLTFFVIDRINPYMQFIDHPMTKWLLAIFSVSSFVTACLLIARQRQD